MIVIAIIGIIMAIASVTWLKQRELSQKRACQENLASIDGAKEQWALANNRSDDATPVWADLVSADGSGIIRSQPACPGGGAYSLNAVSAYATCTVVEPSDHNEK
jgi:type II secretory pathway pseudopilin PulG